MSFLDDVLCPISNVKVNNAIVRGTALVVTIVVGLYVFTGIPYFILLAAIDYVIRAREPKYSPFRWVAEQVVKAASIPEHWVDQAPKLFAVRVGLLFSGVSALLLPIAPMISLILAGILMFFAFLDGVFDICMGCITYTYVVLPFYKARGLR